MACVVLAVLAAGVGSIDQQRTERWSSAGPPARPKGASTMAQTIESLDSPLSALLELAIPPSAAAYRHVAREYRRVGVLDQAHEYFTRAVKLDRSDAVSYEALARIWRDWGTPALGACRRLSSRAYAPGPPRRQTHSERCCRRSATSTKQNVVHARARTRSAGWYALNNLCYAVIMTRELYRLTRVASAVAAAPEANRAQQSGAGTRGRGRPRAGEKLVPAGRGHGEGALQLRDHDDVGREYAQARRSPLIRRLLADPGFTLAAARSASGADLRAAAEEHGRDHPGTRADHCRPAQAARGHRSLGRSRPAARHEDAASCGGASRD